MTNCCRCIKLVIFCCLVQLLSAKPVSYELEKDERIEVRNTEIVIKFFHKLVKFCSLDQTFCSNSDRMELYLYKQLHKLSLDRSDIHRIQLLWTSCLDNVEECDLKSTVIATENLIIDSEGELDTIEAEKRGYKDDRKTLVGSTSYVPQLLNKYKNSYMHARHGRNLARHGRRFGDLTRDLARTNGGRTKRKRSLTSLNASFQRRLENRIRREECERDPPKCEGAAIGDM